jgi:outer membrane lipoprotein-sorting protein
MKMRLATLALILLAAILFAGRAGSAADTQAVLTRARERVELADFRAVGHLVRVDAAGKRTSYAVTLKAHWFPGVLRILCEISAPSEAREHILLEMRPKGQSAIQLARPGDKAPKLLHFDEWGSDVMGSGFSYEDFLESQYFWSNQTMVGLTKYGARDCDLIKSMPGEADHSEYSEVRSWLDHTIAYPVYVEKTVSKTGAVKEFTYFGLRQNGGVWSASQVEVKVHGKPGSTLLIVERGSGKANLDLKDFRPEQLTHFQDRP